MNQKFDRRSEETLMLAVFQSAEAQALALAERVREEGQTESQLLHDAMSAGILLAYTRLRALGYTQRQVEKALLRYDEVRVAASHFAAEYQEVARELESSPEA